MAQSATIFKAEVQISDMNRHYYAAHHLTLARHPSETDLRMMLRILVFAIHASDQLDFTRGISSDDEPDIWEKNLSGDIELWIELGTPDEKRIRKACGLAKETIVYTYNQRSADIWWEKNRNHLQRRQNLQVIQISDETADALSQLVQRTMQLQMTIQDDDVYLGNTEINIPIKFNQLK
jgi:uncharacterized protein YaeQ